MESTLSDPVSFLIPDLADLPTMPVVAARIYQMLEDENVSIAGLTKVIQADPVIVSRLVKTANSSFYCSRREINTIPDAIMTIGLGALRGTVLQAALQKLYQPFGPAENMLWEHANAVAIASKFLAIRLRLAFAEEAFLAGLLHDIGMLVLNWTAPERFHILLTQDESVTEADFATEENNIFRVSHGEIGRKVLSRWEFPVELIMAAEYHHQFSELMLAKSIRMQHPTAVYLVAVVSLADMMCLKLGLGYQRHFTVDWEKLHIISILDLDTPRIEQLITEFMEKYIGEWQGIMT